MESFLRVYVRLIISLLTALIVNLAILFTVPPATTFGIIIKDVLSLLVGGVVYFIFLKMTKK